MLREVSIKVMEVKSLLAHYFSEGIHSFWIGFDLLEYSHHTHLIKAISFDACHLRKNQLLRVFEVEHDEIDASKGPILYDSIL